MRPVLVCLLALTMAGCAPDGSRIHYTHYGSYSGSIAHYGARNGEMALAVFGNPTGASNAVFAAAVADALQGTHVNHDVVFVPTDPPPMDGYRTVAVFGGTTQQDICGSNPIAPATPVPGTPGGLGAAYCYEGDVLSFVSARHQPLAGPDDPELRRLLRWVGRELFPPENPEFVRECDIFPALCR